MLTKTVIALQNIKKIVSYAKIKGKSDYPNLRFCINIVFLIFASLLGV